MPGRVVVQWDKEDCADMGIVKVDLLGLGMMAVLEDSLEIIRERLRRRSRSWRICRQTMPDVYETLAASRHRRHVSDGEPRADGLFAAAASPKCFYDIVVQVAIIRPGPIVGQMVHPYLKRRQGREAAGLSASFAGTGA